MLIPTVIMRPIDPLAIIPCELTLDSHTAFGSGDFIGVCKDVGAEDDTEPWTTNRPIREQSIFGASPNISETWQRNSNMIFAAPISFVP